VDYINELRENILEAYTGIFQALSGPKGQRTRTMRLRLSALRIDSNFALSSHVRIFLFFFLRSRTRRLYRRYSGGAGFYFPDHCRPYSCRWVHPPLYRHCWVRVVAKSSRCPLVSYPAYFLALFPHPGG